MVFISHPSSVTEAPESAISRMNDDTRFPVDTDQFKVKDWIKNTIEQNRLQSASLWVRGIGMTE